jgi:CDP-diacylglycerol--glycerol-3-phosphate 3-phosphatidyltransferase
MKREFLTISNVLSISRAILAVPFVLVLTLPPEPRRGWAIALLVVAALTDRLDGDLARWRNEITEWGKIVDPLADKICVVGGAIALVIIGDFPLWFLVALAVRDLLILAGGLHLKRSRGVVLPSNAAGKWTTGIIALTFLLALAGVDRGLVFWLIVASMAGLAISLALYLRRYVEVVRQ